MKVYKYKLQPCEYGLHPLSFTAFFPTKKEKRKRRKDQLQ